MWYRRMLLVHQAIGRVSEVGGNLDDYNDVSRDNRKKISQASDDNLELIIVELQHYNRRREGIYRE